MELRGEVDIAASRQRVWQALNDPEVLVRCIPGCEEVRQLSPTETHVRVALKLGPVRARFVGKILMDDVVADQGCTLHFEGSGGAAGFARGESKVSLNERDAVTVLAYSASASIGGKLGQVGGRMIDASAKQMADQFFNALRANFAQVADAGVLAAAAPSGKDVDLPSSFVARAALPSVLPSASTSPLPSSPMLSESIRVLWFLMGAVATGCTFVLASYLQR